MKGTKGTWRLDCSECGHKWEEPSEDLDRSPESDCPECYSCSARILGATEEYVWKS